MRSSDAQGPPEVADSLATHSQAQLAQEQSARDASAAWDRVQSGERARVYAIRSDQPDQGNRSPESARRVQRAAERIQGIARRRSVDRQRQLAGSGRLAVPRSVNGPAVVPTSAALASPTAAITAAAGDADADANNTAAAAAAAAAASAAAGRSARVGVLRRSSENPPAVSPQAVSPSTPSPARDSRRRLSATLGDFMRDSMRSVSREPARPSMPETASAPELPVSSEGVVEHMVRSETADLPSPPRSTTAAPPSRGLTPSASSRRLGSRRRSLEPEAEPELSETTHGTCGLPAGSAESMRPPPFLSESPPVTPRSGAGASSYRQCRAPPAACLATSPTDDSRPALARVSDMEDSARMASSRLSASASAAAGLGAGYALSPEEMGDDAVERAMTPPGAGAACSLRRSATGSATGAGASRRAFSSQRQADIPTRTCAMAPSSWFASAGGEEGTTTDDAAAAAAAPIGLSLCQRDGWLPDSPCSARHSARSPPSHRDGASSSSGLSPAGSSPRGSSGFGSPRSAASLRRNSDDSSNGGSPDPSPATASPRAASSRATTPPSRGLTPSASSRRLGSLHQASSSQIEAEIESETTLSDLPHGPSEPPVGSMQAADDTPPHGRDGGRSWAAAVTGELGHGASLGRTAARHSLVNGVSMTRLGFSNVTGPGFADVTERLGTPPSGRHSLTASRSAAASLVRVRDQAAGSIALSADELGDDDVERAVTPPAAWSPRRPFSSPRHADLPLQTCVMEPTSWFAQAGGAEEAHLPTREDSSDDLRARRRGTARDLTEDARASGLASSVAGRFARR